MWFDLANRMTRKLDYARSWPEPQQVLRVSCVFLKVIIFY